LWSVANSSTAARQRRDGKGWKGVVHARRPARRTAMNTAQSFPRRPSSSAQESAFLNIDDTTSRSNDGLRVWKRACQIVEDSQRLKNSHNPRSPRVSPQPLEYEDCPPPCSTRKAATPEPYTAVCQIKIPLPPFGSISLVEMLSSGHGEANKDAWKLEFRWTPVSRWFDELTTYAELHQRRVFIIVGQKGGGGSGQCPGSRGGQDLIFIEKHAMMPPRDLVTFGRAHA
jgi:hypothetical protein